MPSDDSLTVKMTAEALNEPGGFDIEKWLSDKLVDWMNKHVPDLTLPAASLGGPSPVGAINHRTIVDDLETVAVKESPLRRDARLVQILRGVKAGTITVEDAALEIVEGRELGRPSEFLGSDALKLVKPKQYKFFGVDFAKEYVNGEWPQTLMGISMKPDTSMKPGEFRLLNEFGINTVSCRPFFGEVKA